MYLAKAKNSFTMTISTGYPAAFEKDKLYSMRKDGKDIYIVKDIYGFDIPFDKDSYEENFETINK